MEEVNRESIIPYINMQNIEHIYWTVSIFFSQHSMA